MSRARERRLLRFVRLVVACLAFIVARPALASVSAFDAADRIVLVAASNAKQNDDAAKPRPARAVPSVHSPAVALTSFVVPEPTLDHATAAFAQTRSLDDLYLRHCSLLC